MFSTDQLKVAYNNKEKNKEKGNGQRGTINDETHIRKAIW
jgi:hypothetical protein